MKDCIVKSAGSTRRDTWYKTEIASGTLGKTIRVALWTIVVLLFLQATVAIVPMVWGWYPVLGRSMQPTFPIWGGYFKFKWLNDPAHQLKVNDIVALKGKTLGHSVKRVAKIDPINGLYVLGDNTNQSLDSSFGVNKDDDWKKIYVPFDEVRGKVSVIWSLCRMQRQNTHAGQVRNAFEFANQTFAVGCYSLAIKSGYLLILYPSGEVKKIEGKYLTSNGTMLYIIKDEVLCLIDPQNPDQPFFQIESLLMSWYRSSPTTEVRITAKPVQYGLKFTLPNGKSMFVRCILSVQR